MPESIQCPSCNRKLRLPAELLGRRVKCPSCGTGFLAAATEDPPPESVPVAPPPPPPVAPSQPVPPSAPPAGDPFNFQEAPASGDDDSYLDEEERLQARDAWRKVRTGITLILYSIGVAIALVILLLCLLVPLATSIGSGNPRAGAGPSAGVGIALIVMGGLLILGGLTILGLRITGQAFCIAAPSKNGAKGLAVAALLLTIAGLFLTLGSVGLGIIEGAGVIPSLPGGRGTTTGLSNLLNQLGNVVGMIESIVFLFYLRAVALGIHNRGLAQSIGYLLMVSGMMAVLFIGLIVVVIVSAVGATTLGAGPQGPGRKEFEGATALAGICGCVFVIMLITYAIWYLVTLFQVRGAISAYLRRLSMDSY